MYDADAAKDDGLEMIYCVHCGSPIGRFADGSHGDVICPRCKEEVVFLFKEGTKTLTKQKRRKRSDPQKT